MNTITANVYLQKKAAILILIASLFFCNYLNAETGRYRVMFGNNPSTEMTIGFDAYETSTNPVLYYSTSPIDANNLQSYLSQTPNDVLEYRGMTNCFVRLTNLTPNQTYYFLVKDNAGISEIYNFETIADHNNTRLSIIGGGDSRNNRDIRAVANKIVSKLNAHAFMFDGDFTDNGTEDEWKAWLDDWQLTINSKNRITPIIPARGNHEKNNEMLVNLFDCAENVYYTQTFANDLFQVYTLNSEFPINGASKQTNWLEEQLINSSSIWKFVQYHKPVRPHVKQKKEGSMQYAFWANLFYQYGVDAVLEGDSHTSKTTWPIIPCSGGFDCKEGFKRDDNNGTVYVGEGALASPLREANDVKSWTRDSGKFYQFKWIFVDKNKMEIRTVRYDADTNTNLMNELSNASRFTTPINLEIWNPPNGEVVTLNKQTSNPSCTLILPGNNDLLFALNEIELSANATGASPISEVQFYVDGTLMGTDNNAPYQLNWKPSSNGVYMISAIALDENGLSSNFDFSVIKIGNRNNIEHNASIDIGTDECFEFVKKKISSFETVKGFVSVDATKTRMADPDVSLQGLRFKEINIPPYAIIKSAHIKFNPQSGNGTANVTIWCEDSANSLPFVQVPFDLTERQKTSNSIEWNNIPDWNSSTSTAGATSPDLTILIQDLIQRPDWTVESPVTFLINGSGTRSASSFMATQILNLDSSTAPTLTVQFSIPDCTGLPCDDGDPETMNERLDENCNCIIIGCTNPEACNYNPKAIRDDGSCILPIITCDDGNPLTINDQLDDDCNCTGICIDAKACNFNSDGSCTYPGMYCSDGDRNTVNDRLDEDCNCIGKLLGCTDNTACNFDPKAEVDNHTCEYSGGLCSDGDRNTVNDRWNENCNCIGKLLGCMDNTACNFDPKAEVDNYSCTYAGELCSDGNPLTSNDRLDENCNCGDEIKGCTDMNACNYNPMATVSNNITCQFLNIGEIALDTIDKTSVRIKWNEESYATYRLLYRRLGESKFRIYVPSDSFVNFSLGDCTTYEFALEMTCQNRDISETSETITYTTSECKGGPQDIYINDKPVLSVYPQPATNYLTIELADNSKADLINIYNIEGKVVINQNDISFDGTVYKTNVKHLPAGIYMVTAIKDNYTETKKVIVK